MIAVVCVVMMRSGPRDGVSVATPAPAVEEKTPVEEGAPALPPETAPEPPKAMQSLLAGVLDNAEGGKNLPSAPFWAVVEKTELYSKFMGFLERNPTIYAKWMADWDTAQRETFEESLWHLHNENCHWTHTALHRTSRILVILKRDFNESLACDAAEPRVRRFMAVAEDGSPAEKQELADALTQFCRDYAEGREADLGNSVPVLAAQLDPDGRTLPIIVSAAERKIEEYEAEVRQDALDAETLGLPKPNRALPSDCRAVAYACRSILDRCLTDAEVRRNMKPAQTGLLREYAHFIEDNGIAGSQDLTMDTVFPLIDYARRLNELGPLTSSTAASPEES